MKIRGKEVTERYPYSELAGNWQKFESFGWRHAYDGELIEPQRYTIYNIENRDSDLLTQSNASEILKIMDWYLKHNFCHTERHNHWACGWVDCIVIPVYTLKGKVSKTFEYFVDNVLERLENYPILNEDDFSQREYEQECSNISDAIHWYSVRNGIEFTDSQDMYLTEQLHDAYDYHGSDWYPDNDDIVEIIEQTKDFEYV